jgi:LacI family transcriptional regulator
VTQSGPGLTKRPSVSRISMQEVAQRAGVAASSVSRVLSGHPNVSDVMRNRVLDAVAALGYEPDLVAQSLRRGATMTVGFVVGDISNPVLSENALGAETRLREAGYSMLLVNSMTDPQLDAEHIRLFAQRRVDGLLLSLASENWPGTLDAVSRAELPVVLVDREINVRGAISTVLAQHETGVEAAVRELAAHGHRRIALVNGPQDLRPARVRANTLRRVARLLGVTSVVRSGYFSAEHGEVATASLLAMPDPPTAIVAGSNQILVGVLRAVRRAGLRIPEDVSLVTCDDVPLAEFLTPPLATIERDHYLTGVIAASLLLELLSGAPPRIQDVPTTFKSNASVGAVPRTAPAQRD